MTDPEKPLLQQLREIFQRSDRGPLLIGLGVIAVVGVIAALSSSDNSESLPSEVAIGEGQEAPGSAAPAGESESAEPTTATETTTEPTSTETATTEAGTTEAASTEDDDSEFATIESVDSSWVAGQGSLYSFAGYLGVIERAQDVGSNYQAARDAIAAEQERLAEQKLEAAKEAERRRALAAYRAALRAAERERERQERLLAERRQRIKEKIQRLREKYKVEPGEECTIPEVQAAFDCSTGYPF